MADVNIRDFVQRSAGDIRRTKKTGRSVWYEIQPRRSWNSCTEIVPQARQHGWGTLTGGKDAKHFVNDPDIFTCLTHILYFIKNSFARRIARRIVQNHLVIVTRCCGIFQGFYRFRMRSLPLLSLPLLSPRPGTDDAAPKPS